MSGDSRTIVLTGASDGIGAAAARQLSAHGHRVIVVGRHPEKTRALATEIGARFFLADYGELDQVHRLADDLAQEATTIDVLANNAGGVMPSPRAVTVDGFERTFQVNHLAPFLLTHLLMPCLSRAAVIQTASVAARRFARFDIDDLQGERRWNPGTAYGDAKLANILFTRELDRRFGPALSAVAFHPGVVATSFAAGAGGPWEFLYHNPLARRVLTSTETGGARLTWLAEGEPGVRWRRGGYYERNRLAHTNPLADDAGLAGELWRRSAALLGL
ncbi:SDR family NAD(P)-dependent oxidoreductase [Microbacterium sp.]|uniref:SDR family NAD(P)-dependent oxidoreductase n=1 Tax=Microbacterium sp. TaxID=51671 RepID=UPI0039E48866